MGGDVTLADKRDIAKLSLIDCFGGLPRLEATYSAQRFDWHSHPDEYVIVLLTRGAEAFHCRGGSHVAFAGSVVVHAPGEGHDGYSASSEGWSVKTLYPSVAVVERALGVSAPEFRQIICSDPDIAQQLFSFHALAADGKCTTTVENALLRFLQVLAISLGGAVSRPRNIDSGTHRKLCRVHDIIERRFAERLTLESLAREVHLHPNYLVTAFREAYGLTPSRMLCSRRLTAAKKLIREGASLATVATEVGFCDQAHFARRFKGTYGVTPSQFRVHARETFLADHIRR